MASANNTTSTLIPFASRQVGTKTTETVDGRHIHAFLSISRDYSDWIKRQIKSGQFIENKDYIVFYQSVENSKGGRPSTEYFFTFRASEHIGMMSRTTKGREIREYFLDLEEQHQPHATHIPQVRDPAIQMLIDMAVHLDEARTIAAEAKQLAAVAETNAAMALADAHRMTVEEFLLKNGLYRQFPPPESLRISNWLRDFCDQYGLAFPKAPVYGKPWDNENSYPLQALAAWLRYEQKRPRQVALVP